MNWSDSLAFSAILLAISVVGIAFGRRKPTHTNQEALVGTDVSVVSIALSVCSSFLSAVSLLGFPSEVYYRGTTPVWFIAVYFVAFPIVAFVFLPVFYNLKLPSIYEYLERRFSFSSRIVASCTFIVQTVFYLAIALYAPALALAQAMGIHIFASILITSLISAVYLFLGGARGGIYTSALQMGLILISLFVICVTTMAEMDMAEMWRRSGNGLRLFATDLRPNPQVRHSVLAFLLGGSGNIFSLFAVNQLTLQRYMVMPTLRKAQAVILLNIPMNAFMAVMYTFLGLAMYAVYHGCHPYVNAPDQILPYFVSNYLNWLPGLEGVFVAAVYSAGISTLTASYNALTAVAIEDIIKPVWSKVKRENAVLDSQISMSLIKLLPFLFALLATIFAMAIKSLDTMILQIAFSIFGAAGGAILAIFVLGLFCPRVTNPLAALTAQLTACLVTGWIASGSLYYNVVPVSMPLSRTCTNSSFNEQFEWNDSFGTVKARDGSGIWYEMSQVSYHYYCVAAIIACVMVGQIVQFLLDLISGSGPAKVNPSLLAFSSKARPPNIVIEGPESQCLSKQCSVNEDQSPTAS